MNKTQALERARGVIRRQHKAMATEQVYLHWIGRYITAPLKFPSRDVRQGNRWVRWHLLPDTIQRAVKRERLDIRAAIQAVSGVTDFSAPRQKPLRLFASPVIPVIAKRTVTNPQPPAAKGGEE